MTQPEPQPPRRAPQSRLRDLTRILTPTLPLGARANYAYKIGHYGVGYYKDEPPKVEVTAARQPGQSYKLTRRRLG